MKENKNNFDPRCHIGETHGIYTIVDMLDEKDRYGHYIYIGECNECGYKQQSHYGDFVRKGKKFNICKHSALGTDKYIPLTKWDNHRIGIIFRNIKIRCYNEEDDDYKWYGAKGVKVCDEWLNRPKLFEEWALQNGYADNLTIDRIDENKDYCPENCRWIPLEDNARRAGKVNWITVGNITLTGRQWAEKLGLGLLTINKYVKEYGLNKTKELISMMLKEPPKTKNRGRQQTWFSVYNIQI